MGHRRSKALRLLLLLLLLLSLHVEYFGSDLFRRVVHVDCDRRPTQIVLLLHLDGKEAVLELLTEHRRGLVVHHLSIGLLLLPAVDLIDELLVRLHFL